MASKKKFNRKIKILFSGDKKIEGLRVAFRVERIVADAYAKMKIDIYNLKTEKESENETAFKSGDPISVDAGYEGNVSTVFSGTIRNVQKVRSGVDIITTIFASDLKTENDKIISVSYRKQSKLTSLISDVAFEADIEIAEISVKSQNIKGKIVYAKKFSEIMNDLARSYNFTWYIFNGELYIYDINSANTKKEILVIDATTGLLDSPVLTQKGIDVKMLLEPSVKPMDRYEVRSGGVQLAQNGLEVVERLSNGLGLQTVLSVVHTGDTHATQWFTEIEGYRASV